MGCGDFGDEIDFGSLFDQIDDLIDFPDKDNGCGLCGSDDFPNIWSNPAPCDGGFDPIFTGNINTNTASDLSAELSVPYEDIVQLEWLSTFVEDSFSSGGGMTLEKQNPSINKNSTQNHLQTSSPVSVLDSSSTSSSSSSSVGKPATLSPTQRGPHRIRSKRPRPAIFNPRPAIQLLSPTSSLTENPQLSAPVVVSSDSQNFVESHFGKKLPKTLGGEHKKKKAKMLLPSGPAETNQNPPSQSVRKCMHCEITKTPQWRAGPMGPKSLCNACGVRYKSGRLFPEYRPAASPTFVPSLHSNSHKKVIEMRTKTV